MKIAINAISAKRGGAVTYLQNMLPVLRQQLSSHEGGRIVVWRPEGQTADEAWPQEIEFRQQASATGGVGAVGSTFGRLWFDHVTLPRLLKSEHFDVLFSSANFGPLRTESRHVLLVRNTIYFDPVYEKRVGAARVRARHLAQRWLILKCMSGAEAVLFPSETMRDLIVPFVGSPQPNWFVAPYGTRHDLLRPPERESERRPHLEGRLNLLNVSLYADQKNFGTLFGAMAELNRRTAGRYHLRITAGFDQDWLAQSPYFPNYEAEREQYRQLAAIGVAEDTGWRRYGSIGELYRASQVFIFPSYVESFGHPLLEAMAAGIPVVAADCPCNREMCGDAAVYFSAFDARACADAIERVTVEEGLAASLGALGLARAQEFTWERHVDVLLNAMRPDKDSARGVPRRAGPRHLSASLSAQ